MVRPISLHSPQGDGEVRIYLRFSLHSLHLGMEAPRSTSVPFSPGEEWGSGIDNPLHSLHEGWMELTLSFSPGERWG